MNRALLPAALIRRALFPIAVAAALAAVAVAITLGAASTEAAQPQDRLVSVLIGFEPGQAALATAAVADAGGTVTYQFTLIPVVSAEVPGRSIGAIASSSGVSFVEMDRLARVSEHNPDGETIDWGAERVDAPDAHATTTGTGVKVAVIDTGVNCLHLDLDLELLCGGGWDYVDGDSDASPDGLGIFYGHGTHVAGVIAARSNDIGVLGVAPAVVIVPYRVCNSDGLCPTSYIARAIEHATAAEVDVINLSLGSVRPSRTERLATDAAYSAGVLIFAAAGNNSSSRVEAPARYDSVIAVSAIAFGDTLASFSNYGKEIEVTAPGVDVLSTWANDGSSTTDGYHIGSGTSMSTAHAAAVGALIVQWAKANALDATVSELREHLKATADDFNVEGRDDFFGYGVVDALAAVLADGLQSLPSDGGGDDGGPNCAPNSNSPKCR